MTQVLSKSLIRRLEMQMKPAELARFLARTVDMPILQKAWELGIKQEIASRQPGSPEEGDNQK